MEAIIILALVFGFVALRLYSVLGKRTGHEQPLARPVEAPPSGVALPRAPAGEPAKRIGAVAEADVDPRAREGVRAIVAADASFDPERFLQGARSAYRMILEAFWKGDQEELSRLVGDEVRGAFERAIADRAESGHVLDNRLVAIEQAVIESATIDAGTAHVTVRFDADIAAVTRDRDEVVVAGSMSDAVSTHDRWTFSRPLRSADPNWILTETDEAA